VPDPHLNRSPTGGGGYVQDCDYLVARVVEGLKMVLVRVPWLKPGPDELSRSRVAFIVGMLGPNLEFERNGSNPA
jgi:hypothetical protein